MRFVRRLDAHDRLTFRTLASEEAQPYDFEEGTMAVVRCGLVYLRSEAVRVMLQEAGGVALLGSLLLKATPLFLRDRVYRWVAKNRYRWFGKAGGVREADT
jgi:predicted DCC family thiol-disulfide oxidoreductase YuxK